MRIRGRVGATLAAVVAMSAMAMPSASAADDSLWGGVGCDAVGVRNPHALINPDPNTVHVAFQGSFFVVGTGFYAGVPGTELVMTCWIQINDSTFGGGGIGSASSTASPGVTVLPTQYVTISALPTDTLYVCTQETWIDPDGTPYTGVSSTCPAVVMAQ